MTVTKSLWHITGSTWIDTDPEMDVIALTVSGNGKDYAVSCAGPKGMKSNEFITAMRAAAAALIMVGGGDLTQVGAETAEDSTFDTGNQRPS